MKQWSDKETVMGKGQKVWSDKKSQPRQFANESWQRSGEVTRELLPCKGQKVWSDKKNQPSQFTNESWQRSGEVTG